MNQKQEHIRTIQPIDRAALGIVTAGLPADVVAEAQQQDHNVHQLFIINAFECALKNAGIDSQAVFYPEFCGYEDLSNGLLCFVTTMQQTAWGGLGVLTSRLWSYLEQDYYLFCTPLNSPSYMVISLYAHLHCVSAGWTPEEGQKEPWLVNTVSSPGLSLAEFGSMTVYRTEFEHFSD